MGTATGSVAPCTCAEAAATVRDLDAATDRVVDQLDDVDDM